MSKDPFASGLRPEDDLALTGPLPEAPGMIETFNLWLYDGARDICVNLSPHLHAGRVRASATVFLPGGRILRRHNGDEGGFTDPCRPGNAYVRYECVEPFRRWTCRLADVPMIQTSDEEIASGAMRSDAPSVRVSAEIHLTTRSPAWIMGELLPESAGLNDTPMGLWMGSRLKSGPSPLARRYEQLAQAQGTITVDGEVLAFDASGMRAHVRGERDTTGMSGHYWSSALFPSGRGVAMTGYQDREGRVTYHEGYVCQDGRRHPARIRSAPPMDRLPRSAPFVVELEAEGLGPVRLEGRDRHSFAWSCGGWAGLGSDQMKPVYGVVPEAPLVMKQSPVAYVWDGETGYGMREISGELSGTGGAYA